MTNPGSIFLQADTSSPLLLLWAVLAIGLLIVLIAQFRLNAFLALLISSISLGLMTRMSPGEIVKGFQEGLGSVLSSIAVIIGLGAMIGKMVSVSGGADVIAQRFITWGGERRLTWSLLLLALVVGMSVFFAVGLVVLFPIVVLVAHRSKLNVMTVAIPVLAGLSVMHGLVPPHAGPMAAIGILKADVGKTLVLSLLVGIPTAMLAGPVFGAWISRRITLSSEPLLSTLQQEATQVPPPPFGVSLFTLFLPIGLMCLSTISNLFFKSSNPVHTVLVFLGSPMVALLIGVLVSFYTFGLARGFSGRQLLKFSEECLGPIGATLLVVGAGGGFSRMLTLSGVGETLANLLQGTQVSPVFLAWLIAAMIRVATGSATVAITTAAGLMIPLMGNSNHVSPEIIVLALGAGSLILSHVNDGGFWLVKEFFQMPVPHMLKSWTVMETIISVVALVFILILQTALKSFSA